MYKYNRIRRIRGAHVGFLALLLILSTAPFGARAQNFRLVNSRQIPVIHAADTLVNAWAGGLNAAQFSTMDLNGDGVEDLVLFDRSTSKVSTFLAEPHGASYRWRYASRYEAYFPDMQAWMLLRDYDGDGKKDIFTRASFGAKVYRNVSAGGEIRFEQMVEFIETRGESGLINLSVLTDDIPAIVDMDGDGDLDIIVADQVGTYLRYHQNMSMETYGHADSLVYQLMNPCWGDFAEGADCDQYVFGIDCSWFSRPSSRPLRVQHAGSTILAIDLDGDNVKDLLLGDVSCPNLYQLINRGGAADARFTEVNNQFPPETPVNFMLFPAAFYEDVTFDGKRDLIVAPNVRLNEGDLVNFRNANWLYVNQGTDERPDFRFAGPDFLQNTMIDWGENAFPALADYDGDGDLDLFIGHRGHRTEEGFFASIVLYKNTGTAQQPVFTLESEDYLNLSALRVTNIRPFFADINGDRSMDLYFTATDPATLQTSIRYLINSAPRGQAFAFSAAAARVLPLALNPNDSPFLFDVDGDGRLDVLLGKGQGSLEYYRNTGTFESPGFAIQNSTVGGLPRDFFDMNLSITVADLNGDGRPDLITGDLSGKIQVYPDFVRQLNDNFTSETEVIFDTLAQQYVLPKLGGSIFLTTADLTGNGLPDVLVGTQAGGMYFLHNRAEGGTGGRPTVNALISRNPTDRYVYIRVDQESTAEIFSTLGQQMQASFTLPANTEVPVDLLNYARGVYLVRIRNREGTVTKKIIKQ